MWLRWVLWLRVTCDTAVKIVPGLQSPQRSAEERSPSKLTHVILAGFGFLQVVGLRASFFSLAVCQRTPPIPCVFSTGQLTTWLFASSDSASEKSQREKEGDRERRKRKRERDGGQVFYNLISEVAFHYFCCILFVIGKSPSPEHSPKDRKLHKGMNTRRRDH